jgi:hypothetical protein
MTPRTPQCEVFWALLSNSKHSGVPEDFKSPTLEVLGFTPTLAKVGLRHTSILIFILDEESLDGNVPNCNEMAMPISLHGQFRLMHPIQTHLETSLLSTPKTTLHGGIMIL